MEKSMNKRAVGLKKSAAKMRRKLGYKPEAQNITWIEWTLLGLIVAFCFVSFHYVDMDSILDNTVLFVRSVTDGQFFDFYKYSMEHASTDWAANYELPVYILFAIWNLPTIILGYFIPVTYTKNIVCILWAKLMLIVFIALSAFIIYKIVRYIGLERQRGIFSAFLFSSSTLLIMFTNVISQMEIVSVFFMLLGIYYYIQDNNKGFLISFAVAITMKMFALFVFVPLVLLKVKNVFKIIGYGIGGMSLQLLCKLIFINSAEYHYATSSNTASVIDRLIKGNIVCGNSEIPLFLLTLVLVCVYAYAVKPKDKNEMIRLSFYMPLVVFSAMYIFFTTNTYWITLIVPFITLAIIMNPRMMKLNLFLEIAVGASYCMYCFCYSKTFTLVKSTFDQMLLNRLFPVPSDMQRQYTNVKNLMKSLGIIDFKNIFFCIFAAALIALLVINRPRKDMTEIGNREKINYSVIWARFAILFVMVGIVTFSYMKTTPKAIINTADEDCYATSYSITDENTVLKQDFSVDKDFSSSKITVRFENQANNRKNMGNVRFRIFDKDGNILLDKTQGTSLLPKDNEYSFSFKAELKKDEVYTLELSGVKNNNTKPTRIIVVDETDGELPKAELNGATQNYSLYMKVR